MLEDLLAQRDLHINIPQDTKTKLATIVGQRDIIESRLISIALMHSSYTNEHSQDFIDVGIPINSILGMLTNIGSSYIELALHHVAYNDPRMLNPGEIVQLIAGYKKGILLGISNHFQLSDLALVGKGESNNRYSSTIQSSLALQFIGALRICSNYGTIYSLLEKLTKQKSISATHGISYKNELMIYSQSLNLGLPRYELLGESGPDHEKQFSIRVSTVDGKSCNGQGLSKKRAEEAAAYKYMGKFGRVYLRQRLQPKGVNKRPHTCPEQHRQDINNLSKLLEIPSKKSGLLSQALVHSSFLNETRQKDCQDNGTLAQLGALVIDAICTDIMYEYLIEYSISALDDFPFKAILGFFKTPEIISQGFDLLNLQKALLLSRGQKLAGTNLSIKSNAYQAVVAVLFLNAGTTDEPESLMHKSLITTIHESIVSVINDHEIAKDSKSMLQEQLQALELTWKYDTIGSGKEHERKYHSTITIYSDQTKESLRLKNNKEWSTLKEAERSIAHTTCRIIEIANSKLISELIIKQNKEGTTKRCVIFFLQHEFASAPSNYLSMKRWCKFGFLGSQILLADQSFEFARWIKTVDLLLGDNTGKVPNQIGAISFYERVLRTIKRNMEHVFSQGIDKIADFLHKIDLNKQNIDFGNSDEFSISSSLPTMFKLRSQRYQSVKIADILDNFLLLRRNRIPNVQLVGETPDVELYTNDSIHQTMLNEAIRAIGICSAADNTTVRLSVVFDPMEMTLSYTFSVLEHLDLKALRKAFADNYLWQFLRQIMPILNIEMEEDSLIKLSCGAFPVFSQESLFTQALVIYNKGDLSESESEAIGRTLHDLKNEMVACQVALDSAGERQTQKLKAKYEASLHLDNAIALCQMARSISMATGEPDISNIYIGDFFRHYVAEKITNLPYNVRIIPPNNPNNNQFCTSEIFLFSIIENLVKNSVEAMPDGGEVKFDWIYDETNKYLLIEIVDSGIGIEQNMLNGLISGKSVESNKTLGSGIGMLTVKSMLQRIGGTLSAMSEVAKGTRWTIGLPSLEDRFEVEDDLGMEDMVIPDVSATQEVDLP